MTKEKLKPCPFCGSDAFERRNPFLDDCPFYVKCSCCEAWTGDFETPVEAVNRWNTRAGEKTE